MPGNYYDMSYNGFEYDCLNNIAIEW
jgi:hypothetical protein